MLLSEVAKQLTMLRASATNNTDDIEYSDLAAQLNEMRKEVMGRRPLRTGAIIATSMIPFRAVCAVGFD